MKKVTFSEVVGDLQLGDQKVTLNHLGPYFSITVIHQDIFETATMVSRMLQVFFKNASVNIQSIHGC